VTDSGSEHALVLSCQDRNSIAKTPNAAARRVRSKKPALMIRSIRKVLRIQARRGRDRGSRTIRTMM